MEVLIESKGFKIDSFYVPPFALRRSEIVVINLFNGTHYYNLEMQLANIFTGKVKHEEVELKGKLTFLEYYRESTLQNLLFPMTVKRFVRKHMNKEMSDLKSLCAFWGLTPSTKIMELPWFQRKMLSLNTTLSNTKDIVFDLVGLDPNGAREVFEVVKENVRQGGAALLLDYSNEMKEDCTRFITIEVDENYKFDKFRPQDFKFRS